MTNSGSAPIETPSQESDSQSSESSSSSPLPPSPTVTLASFLTSLMGISGVLYVWIGTSKLDKLPQWVPLIGLVLCMIPGGVLGRELGSTARVVVRMPLNRLLGKTNTQDK